MHLFLNIVTKSKYILLFNDSQILQKYIWDESGQESNQVLFGIHKVCEDAKISFKNLSSIYAVIGPGTFTGLRIALTCVNTLKFLYPTIKLYGYTIGDIIAINHKASSYVFSPYPSDVFLFDADGEFIDRIPTTEWNNTDNNIKVLCTYETDQFHNLQKINEEDLMTFEAMKNLPQKQESEQLLPFYAKHPNISTQKKII